MIKCWKAQARFEVVSFNSCNLSKRSEFEVGFKLPRFPSLPFHARLGSLRRGGVCFSAKVIKKKKRDVCAMALCCGASLRASLNDW